MDDLVTQVREHAAAVAATAQSVRIDSAALNALAAHAPAHPPPPDPVQHYLEGSPADVAMYVLTLDAINFGSGWFPTLRKRTDPATGRSVSGYQTIAWALADRFRTAGPWDAAGLRALRADELARILGQPPDHELMALYAQALRQLGRFLGTRDALALVRESGSSAVALATALASQMSMWADRGCYKRAQIVASDLQCAGVARFADLDRLTIFADNLVPHVLRCEGVLVYSDALAARIDAEQLLPMGPWEREIRGCAIHACEQLSAQTQIAPWSLDGWLWNRGQDPAVKTRPRHRCRNIYY